MRSPIKKDYPNLLDITSAGHLLANETVQDGVREIQEELGISVLFENLVPLGQFNYCVEFEKFIDKELANIFLYRTYHPLEDFTFQEQEVSGVVKAKLEEFNKLWYEEMEFINVVGFEMIHGERKFINRTVKRKDFVPHPLEYYQTVIERVKNTL